MKMNPIQIIEKYYNPTSQSYQILLIHSKCVLEKALQIANQNPEENFDIQFVKEAAMLHDIGIFLTDAPRIDCHGEYPYICHGFLGSELLQKEGYSRHALVCERHTGTGISLEQIITQNLPIPHRDMRPQTKEEELICFADKFFSKTHLDEEMTVEKARGKLLKFGEDSLSQFDAWCAKWLR